MMVPIRDTTVLRQRMIENIRMRKLSPKTQGALIPAYADWPHTSAALPILRKKNGGHEAPRAQPRYQMVTNGAW
jgi:hypothetical protein